MSEDQELEQYLDKALAEQDAYLAHWYGSQIQHRREIKELVEKRSRDFMEKLELLKQECEENAEDRLLKFIHGIK